MIYLYQFPAVWGLPNASPFCMKVEMYLRLAHLDYSIKTVMNPKKSPKGKLPFIKDDGVVVADSSFIVAYLKKKYGDILDVALTEDQCAIGLMLQRTLEEHLYWIMIYARWVDEPGAAITKKDFFKPLPAVARLIVPGLVIRDMKKALNYQGISRHHRDEIYELGKQDILAVATILANKLYIFGDEPCSYDAILYAFLANILRTPIASPLKEFANTIPTLSAYCDRMEVRTAKK